MSKLGVAVTTAWKACVRIIRTATSVALRRAPKRKSFQLLPVSPLHLAAARRRAASCWSESVQSLGRVAYSRLPWCRLSQADFLGRKEGKFTGDVVGQ
jgi:hypothetical protein